MFLSRLRRRSKSAKSKKTKHPKKVKHSKKTKLSKKSKQPKVSKKSKYQWSGRTEGGIWVVFDKTNEKIGEIIDVNIDDARGVTLFGSRTYQGYNYEVA